MANAKKNPQDDDHIEDLLSQLQGIFGKLSRQEEEDVKEKIELPKPPAMPPVARPIPVERLTPPPPVPAPIPTPMAPPVQSIPVPPPMAAPKAEPAPLPVAIPKPEPVAALILEPVAAPKPVEPPPLPSVPMSSAVPPAPAPAPVDDPSQLATVIAFPVGRDAEAKSLAQRLETITPKFTKVAFRLKVTQAMAYDPKSEWKDAVLEQLVVGKARTLFLVIDRPLDEARRKAVMAELEKIGVYFQEVPLLSIEKKAFYTDVLLGLVFFMDSQKPGESGQAA